MDILLLIALSIICGYFIGGINGAIILGRLVYHEDIREMGSNNPGFTNFKRVHGICTATWLVLIIDLLKTILPVLIFSTLFEDIYSMRQLGAAITGFSCMLGHAYPIWYGFKGGKTFVASVVTVFFIDWRVGLVSLLVFAIVLATTKYMSLASMSFIVTCPIALVILGVRSVEILLISSLCALLLVWRHRANIQRLLNKTESKFTLKKSK